MRETFRLAIIVQAVKTSTYFLNLKLSRLMVFSTTSTTKTRGERWGSVSAKPCGCGNPRVELLHSTRLLRDCSLLVELELR